MNSLPGGGGGGGTPLGKTCTGIFDCIAAKADGGNGPLSTPALGLCGTAPTPSAFAFLVILFAILGDLICDKSSPPGVYVNGFLSFVIIAFWTHAGGSGRLSEISAFRRTAGTAPKAKGGGGGGGTPFVFDIMFDGNC